MSGLCGRPARAHLAAGRPVFIAFCFAALESARSAPATCTQGRSPAMKPRSVPKMTTDEDAEAFLDNDLSDLDFAAFKPLTWEVEPKTARVNMRLPAPLMEALKARAAERG